MNQPAEVVEEQPTRVGIALVARNGSYLVRKRPVGTVMAGVWEFPGGKCEPGESPEVATQRECLEEIGVEVDLVGLRRCITHRYAHAWVELHFFDAKTSDPAVMPLPETGFVWVPAKELPTLTFPGANEPILEELVREANEISST